MGIGTVRINALALLRLLSEGPHAFRVVREGIPADASVVSVEADEPTLGTGIVTVAFHGPSVEGGREYRPVLETEDLRHARE